MPRTVADVLASAREIINDTDGGADGANYRTADTVLVGFVVDALNAMRNVRPDLFLGQWGELTVTAASPLPVDAQFFRPVVNFVAGMAELKDDEHVLSGRAKLMADLMGSFLR